MTSPKRSLTLLALTLIPACGDDGATGAGAGGGSSATATSGTGTPATATAAQTTGQGGSGGGAAACVPIDLGVASQATPLPMGCTGPTCASTGLVALTDLTGGDYLGVPGGLYCGANTRPAAYEAEGVALGQGIVPLSAAGTPDPSGHNALVSIGMSNTTQEFSRFITKYDMDPLKHPSLVLVDGAMGAHATPQWIDPQNDAWTNLTSRLMTRGVTDAQVVALWVKLAQQSPQTECTSAGFMEPCFPAHADKLAADIRTILGMLTARFQNLQIIYLSSRIYAGYATTQLNPEPYAYQSGFSVKKLVVEKIMGDPAAAALPYLSWGPYLWSDGTTENAEGLSWTVNELQPDGTHPAGAGQDKVADLLFEFFTTDATAAPWFVGP